MGVDFKGVIYGTKNVSHGPNNPLLYRVRGVLGPWIFSGPYRVRRIRNFLNGSMGVILGGWFIGRKMVLLVQRTLYLIGSVDLPRSVSGPWIFSWSVKFEIFSE